MERAPTASIVIPCRNAAATIGLLLDAILSQTRTPDEVVVVDDGSTDASREVVTNWQQEHPGGPGLPEISLHLIAGLARGVAAAMNTGIAHARGDVIVRLDAHCVPAPGYVERALAALSESGAGIVGGVWRIEPATGSVTAAAIAAVVSHPIGSGGAQYRSTSPGGPVRFEVETVPFGVFRRSLWQQLGGYDEALAANEDFDFNYRARRAGASVLLDRRIESMYRARPSLSALARQYHRYGFWKVQMLRKDSSALHWRQVPPALVVPWLVVSTSLAGFLPSVIGVGSLLLYPGLLTIASLQLTWSASHRMNGPVAQRVAAVCAAFAIVHVAWSLGFWRALLGGAPPVGRPTTP